MDISWVLNNLKSQTAVLRCSRKELIWNIMLKFMKNDLESFFLVKLQD